MLWWVLLAWWNLMIISNESMNFKDPKEFDDPQLFDDPSSYYSMIPRYSMIPAVRWSIRSMDFDNRKVYGNTSITDGLVNTQQDGPWDPCCFTHLLGRVLRLLQGWGEEGLELGLRDLLLRRRRKTRKCRWGVFYHPIFLKLNPCLPQARDQNPEYDDYDYMESNMHNIVKDSNPQYVTNWKEHAKYRLAS